MVVSALALFPATWLALARAAVREGRMSRRAAALSAVVAGPIHGASGAQVYGVGSSRR